MMLSALQRYNLNYCINFFRRKSQLQPLVEILKDVLNESQTRDNFKKNMLALIALNYKEGPSKQVSIYILEHFFKPFDLDIFDELAHEYNAWLPVLSPPAENWPNIAELISQKFPPALSAKEAALLGYAPAQLELGIQYCGYGAETDKKKAKEYFMQAFEQGMEDDQSIFEYTKCFEHNKNRDRRCYLWQMLIERGSEYTQSAASMLKKYTKDIGNDMKSFQQLLQEATPIEITQNQNATITIISIGDPKAQALVGFCYHIGLGVQQNIAKAIHFYKISLDPDTWWDLLSCFKRKLMSGSIDIRDVLEFYKLNLNEKHCLSEYYMIPANLILANIYHEGIMGFVYPNLFKAYEYYSQSLKLTSSNTKLWEEEYKLAQEAINAIQPLIASRDQILSSLAPLGVTMPLCNLTAEYCYDFQWPDSSNFSRNIAKIDADFSCIENKYKAESKMVAEMSSSANSLVLSNSLKTSVENFPEHYEASYRIDENTEALGFKPVKDQSKV